MRRGLPSWLAWPVLSLPGGQQPRDPCPPPVGLSHCAPLSAPPCPSTFSLTHPRPSSAAPPPPASLRPAPDDFHRGGCLGPGPHRTGTGVAPWGWEWVGPACCGEALLCTHPAGALRLGKGSWQRQVPPPAAMGPGRCRFVGGPGGGYRVGSEAPAWASSDSSPRCEAEPVAGLPASSKCCRTPESLASISVRAAWGQTGQSPCVPTARHTHPRTRSPQQCPLELSLPAV